MKWVTLFFINFFCFNAVVSLLLYYSSTSDHLVTNESFKIGVSKQQITSVVGDASKIEKDIWNYNFLDENNLTLYFDHDELIFAVLAFKDPMNVDEFDFRDKLVPVKHLENKNNLYGVPERGIVFELDSDKKISSINWIRPWVTNISPTKSLAYTNFQH